MVESRRLLSEANNDTYSVRSTTQNGGPTPVQLRGTQASFPMRKVVLVGDTGVGKTAILSRYISGRMPPHRRSTMGATEKIKNIHIAGANKKLPL